MVPDLSIGSANVMHGILKLFNGSAQWLPKIPTENVNRFGK